ncbi:hypothetical protein N865_18015 [Intrasporangium oryzae NRRL B-24470]|uniref:Uncharacterized protein n=1 Tax=Intrasporangium oryzae NRRL B-24470 TaxID=1386089 RepID=W9G461_9MICO|nr:hypothetical protein [Intrasporangium oryzae]EWT00087.1 hypothetical protein N865_18015 [Intrasporangium oryzae NRRL B-24470]
MKYLKQFFVAIVAAVAAVALGTSTAFAAVTVKSPPTIVFNEASATVSGGNFSGLGNIPLYGTLTVTGVANYTCYNPQGHPSPGQNPVQAGSGTSGPVLLPTSKNGRATVPDITASVTAPPTPTAQQVGCGGTGSTQWTVVLTSLTATAAQFVVTQSGATLFCWNYTLGGPNTGTTC